MKDPKKSGNPEEKPRVPSLEDAHRIVDGATKTAGPLGPGQRWTTDRKRQVVLRLLRGEAVESVSRELGVPVFKLESWLDRALEGMDANLKERTDDPISVERDQALKRIGELTMENELLRHRCGIDRPFNFRRSKR